MKFKTRKGISLVELVLTTAIIGIILQVAYSLFFVGSKSFVVSRNIGFAQQDARLPIDYIVKNIRNAESVYVAGVPDKYPHYKISVDSNNLTLTTYTSADVEGFSQSIGSEIESLEFIPIWIDKAIDDLDYNRLNLVVIAVEDGTSKEYTTMIRFENTTSGGAIKRPLDDTGSIIDIPSSTSTIYYTKYE